MTFEQSDLKKIAHLARLSLSQEEATQLQEDMDRIVRLVTKLSEVNVEGVKPMSHAGDRILEFREDEAREVLGRKCIDSSRGYEEGLVRVPKIID